jgi:hypothetical protein
LEFEVATASRNARARSSNGTDIDLQQRAKRAPFVARRPGG